MISKFVSLLTRGRTKESRITQRASTTPPPVRRADNLYPSTHPGFHRNTAPPLATGLHPTPTLPPSGVGGTNTYERTIPLRELNAPEVSIMYVLCSPFTPRWSASPLTDSVMGATGSGKSTVRLFLIAICCVAEKLIIHLRGWRSSSTSSVGQASVLAADYDLAQTLYKQRGL